MNNHFGEYIYIYIYIRDFSQIHLAIVLVIHHFV